MTATQLLGGVEAGGTKFVCVVGAGPDEIHARARIDTTTPAETMQAVIAFFESQPPLAAIGVASFGPVELRRDHREFGHITTTPKPGWSGADVVGPLVRRFAVPVGFAVDVVGAALGEQRFGAGKGARHVGQILR